MGLAVVVVGVLPQNHHPFTLDKGVKAKALKISSGAGNTFRVSYSCFTVVYSFL